MNEMCSLLFCLVVVVAGLAVAAAVHGRQIEVSFNKIISLHLPIQPNLPKPAMDSAVFQPPVLLPSMAGHERMQCSTVHPLRLQAQRSHHHAARCPLCAGNLLRLPSSSPPLSSDQISAGKIYYIIFSSPAMAVFPRAYGGPPPRVAWRRAQATTKDGGHAQHRHAPAAAGPHGEALSKSNHLTSGGCRQRETSWPRISIVSTLRQEN